MERRGKTTNKLFYTLLVIIIAELAYIMVQL